MALDGIVWAAASVAAQMCVSHAEPFGIKFGSGVLRGRTAAAWPGPSPCGPVVASGAYRDASVVRFVLLGLRRGGDLAPEGAGTLHRKSQLEGRAAAGKVLR